MNLRTLYDACDQFFDAMNNNGSVDSKYESTHFCDSWDFFFDVCDKFFAEMNGDISACPDEPNEPIELYESEELENYDQDSPRVFDDITTKYNEMKAHEQRCKHVIMMLHSEDMAVAIRDKKSFSAESSSTVCDLKITRKDNVINGAHIVNFEVKDLISGNAHDISENRYNSYYKKC